MVLSGAKYSIAVMTAFPLSLVAILSSGPFSINIDILGFFPKTVPIPFLPFLSGGPRGSRGQNHPRLCLRMTWTFIIRSRLYPSSARALGPNVKMGQGHKLLGPTVRKDKNTIRNIKSQPKKTIREMVNFGTTKLTKLKKYF